MKYKGIFLIGIFVSFAPALQAGPLTEAKVTRVINDVRLVQPSQNARPATVNDIVKDDIGLETGLKSRSELLFADNTLTRIGPETYFSFRSGTREMSLKQGTMLLQVPKGLGGAVIHTAAITASITGTTIMLEYFPNKDLKVAVLEGSLKLAARGFLGDAVTLRPGQMVIMPPNAKRIPDPVTVDLRKVMKTSSLVNMPGKKGKVGTLPSAQLIENEIHRQDESKGRNNLAETNLIIMGQGTDTLIASDDVMGSLARNIDGVKADHPTPPPLPVSTPGPVSTPPPVATPPPVEPPNPTPNPSPTPNPNPPPVGTPTPAPPGGYTVDNTTTITNQNGSATITTQGVTTGGVVYTNLQTNGSPSAFLFGATSSFDNKYDFDNVFGQEFQHSGVFTFDAMTLAGGMSLNGQGGIALVGDNGITNSPASVVNLGAFQSVLFATAAGNITLDSGISFAPSGDNTKPSFVFFYARGGDVNIGATFTLSHADLQFAAEKNAVFANAASITSNNLNVTGLQAVQFDGNANVSQTFQLNGGTVEVGGTVTANSGFVYGSSASIGGSFTGQQFTSKVSGDFTLTNTGSLTDTGAGNPMTLNAGGNMTVDGTVSAQKVYLTAGSSLEIGGSFTTSDALNVTAASATFNGIMNVKSAAIQTSGDFLLNAGGGMTSSGDVAINSTGGNVTLNATVTGHTVNLAAANNVAINQAIVPNQLDVTGGSISFGTDQSVSSPNNDLTSTNGNIDATGHALSGFDQVSVAHGDFLAGSLDANTLLVSGNGNIVVSGNLTLAHPLTGNNNLSIGGLLSAQTVSAATAALNAVKTNSLTLTGALTLLSSDLSPFSSSTISITAPSITFAAGANLDGNPGTASTVPGNGSTLTISTGAFALATPMSLNGGDAFPSSISSGGNGGTLNLTSSSTITLNAPIMASTGLNGTGVTNGGTGGTVNLTAGDTITLNDKIEVSSKGGQRVSHSGGTINVTSSRHNGVAISVSSSAQLLSLLNAAGGTGGTIKFVSSGPNSAVNVDSATMEADNGTVLVKNTGPNGTVTINNATLEGGTGLVEVDSPSSNGVVNLTNAAIHANAVKISALGSNGTLNVGGGTMDANSVIKLYALGSNGSVNFVDNVTLSGNSVKYIAGDAVTIFNGKIVTVNGPAAASVFTNHANYTGFGGNNSTTGTFAGQGAVTKPLSQAPGF